MATAPKLAQQNSADMATLALIQSHPACPVALLSQSLPNLHALLSWQHQGGLQADHESMPLDGRGARIKIGLLISNKHRRA